MSVNSLNMLRLGFPPRLLCLFNHTSQIFRSILIVVVFFEAYLTMDIQRHTNLAGEGEVLPSAQ
jgi:hypothetical protein